MLTRRQVLVLLAAAGVVGGCLSPTLPLPPPDRPDVEGPDSRGMVTLTGVTPDNSLALVLNTRTQEVRGQHTGHSGYYRFEIQAQVGDDMVFWYSRGTERSPSVRFQIRESPSGTGGASGAGGTGSGGGAGGAAGAGGAGASGGSGGASGGSGGASGGAGGTAGAGGAN